MTHKFVDYITIKEEIKKTISIMIDDINIKMFKNYIKLQRRQYRRKQLR